MQMSIELAALVLADKRGQENRTIPIVHTMRPIVEQVFEKMYGGGSLGE